MAQKIKGKQPKLSDTKSFLTLIKEHFKKNNPKFKLREYIEKAFEDDKHLDAVDICQLLPDSELYLI